MRKRLVAVAVVAVVVLVGVDAPDFNLGLEATVRAAGVPTVQYISPSIWAWRGARIERIRRAAAAILINPASDDCASTVSHSRKYGDFAGYHGSPDRFGIFFHPADDRLGGLLDGGFRGFNF